MGKRVYGADCQRPAHIQPHSGGNVVGMGKVGWIGIGPLGWVFDACLWGLSLVFLLRAIGNLRSFGFFKTVKGTPFAQWDTWLYSPLCVLMAMLAAGLARLPRER
jgi:Protein of unknown function (DUF3995)